MSRSYSRPKAVSSQRHRALQRIHRVGAARLLAVLAIDAQRDLAARHRDELVLDRRRGRPRPWRRGKRASGTDRAKPHSGGPIRPLRLLYRITVGKQHRRRGLGGLDPRRRDREDIRPVEEISDAPETFGFALRAVDAAGAIEAHQLGVGCRIELGNHLEHERPVRYVANHQPLGSRFVAVLGERHAVEGKTGEHELIALQRQRAVALTVTAQSQERRDFRLLRIEPDVELDRVDQEFGGAVIRQAHRRRLDLHCASPFLPTGGSASGQELDRSF